MGKAEVREHARRLRLPVAHAEGKVVVHEVWCAVDCGIVVHPDLVRAQFEA